MMIVRCLGVGTGILLGLYLTYSLKVYLDINLDIFGKEHFPTVIERVTHGWVKCDWFPNSHHCKR